MLTRTDPYSPSVSIIMPTYNRADLIGDTIQSIIDQTYTDWELIIVDDGSEDETEDVLHGFEDRRIRFIKTTHSGKGGKLKNLGLQIAKASLIAFTDSDDLWDSTKLARQVEMLNKHTEAGFCLTGGYNFREKNKPEEYFYKENEGYYLGNIFLQLFDSKIAAFTQALMFRRECLEKAGSFNETRSFSDVDFIVSLARNYTAVLIYEPLVFRRLHANSYIHSDTWEKSYIESVALIKDYEKQKILPALRAHRALFRLYINYGEKCLRNGRRAGAVRQFLNAWRNNPYTLVPLKKIGKAVFSF